VAPPVKGTLAAADLGNSSLKLALFDSRGRLLRHVRRPWGSGGPRLPAWWRAAEHAIAVSVVRTREAAFRRSAGRPVAFLGREIRVVPVPRTRPPGGAGLDRVCAAAAAAARAGGPAVAVTAGSSITVNLADAHGRLLGGGIAPGLLAAAAGLAAAAPALPVFEALRRRGGSPRMPGRSTGDALHAGILFLLAGGVERLVEEAGGGRRLPVYVAGGDAEVLARLLRPRGRAAPHLVLEGLRLLWLRAGGDGRSVR
jgi:pantothenate kinase type III